MTRNPFFDRHHDSDFVMGSAPHLIALSIIAVCCLILFISRFTIRTHPALRQSIRLLLVLLLVASEASLHVWYLSQDIWSRSSSLPLELCGITLLLSVIMLLTRSRMLYAFLYFAGIGGAFIALLTPNLLYPFPHFRFLLFFIAHGSIVLSSLYMTWIEGYRPGWRSLFFTMLCLNIVAAFVYVADILLDSNYMFLARNPARSPYWIISALILIICSLKRALPLSSSCSCS